eukprot:3934814-Rhodomonas_salina.4
MPGLHGWCPTTKRASATAMQSSERLEPLPTRTRASSAPFSPNTILPSNSLPLPPVQTPLRHAALSSFLGSLFSLISGPLATRAVHAAALLCCARCGHVTQEVVDTEAAAGRRRLATAWASSATPSTSSTSQASRWPTSRSLPSGRPPLTSRTRARSR